MVLKKISKISIDFKADFFHKLLPFCHFDFNEYKIFEFLILTEGIRQNRNYHVYTDRNKLFTWAFERHY